MFKKKQSILLLFCFIIIIISLTGCSKKMTAAIVLLKSASAMKEVNAMSGTLNFSFHTIGENNLNLGIEVDTTLQLTVNPSANFMEGTANISIGSMEMGIPIKNYIVQENGSSVFYTQLYQIWGRTEVPSKGPINFNFHIILGGILNKNLKMEIKDGPITQQKETYEVKLEIPGEILKQLISSFSEEVIFQFFGKQIDVSNLDSIVTAIVDKESKRLFKLSFDFTQSGTDLLKQFNVFNRQVTQLCLTINFASFDEVEQIIVPDKVKEKAIEKFGIDKIKSIFSFVG